MLDKNLMAEIFNKPTEPIKKENEFFSLQALKSCSLKDFVQNVIAVKFGMGHDYAINNLKSWFTVKEAVEASKSKGYFINEVEAERYLENLVKKRYFEKREGDLAGIQYRRRVFLGFMNL